jgi:PAS domain S-box-containing protein
MLENLSDQVRWCYERAAEVKAKADRTDDPALKAGFLNLERAYLALARSFGFSERLTDYTASSEQRLERLQEPGAPVVEVRKDLDGPDDILKLYEISTSLIQESDLNALYNRIIDAAIDLMSSDAASVQLLIPERSQLQLLAWKGFHSQSAAFWESVYFNSASTCGFALATGARVVVPDVEICDFMAGTADLDEYRRSNIRAVQSTPLVSRSGQLLGMISTHWRKQHQPAERALRRLDVLGRQAADLIERSRAEAGLRQLASIVENSDDAIITKDLNGIITSWNKSAERLFGFTAEEAIGKPVTILIPLDRRDEEPAILDHLRRGERIDHYETIRQHKDGGLLNVSLIVSPLKNAQGEIIGASKIARDITDRKRSDDHIVTLAREAEHRSKNILATVQATVNLSHADTPDGLKRAIEGRIQALANVHGLLVKSRWLGAELSSIAVQELAPYRAENDARVLIAGPHLLLAPNTAQAVAVTLHELATNAARYGSLSVPKGQIEVTWSRPADGQLILRWIETGGPPAKKPTLEGFGTSVIESRVRNYSASVIARTSS